MSVENPIGQFEPEESRSWDNQPETLQPKNSNQPVAPENNEASEATDLDSLKLNIENAEKAAQDEITVLAEKNFAVEKAKIALRSVEADKNNLMGTEKFIYIYQDFNFNQDLKTAHTHDGGYTTENPYILKEKNDIYNKLVEEIKNSAINDITSIAPDQQKFSSHKPDYSDQGDHPLINRHSIFEGQLSNGASITMDAGYAKYTHGDPISRLDIIMNHDSKASKITIPNDNVGIEIFVRTDLPVK